MLYINKRNVNDTNLLLLLSILWFSLKLELAGNTTILPGRSQLVCPYSRDPFVPSIFINMALVSKSPTALISHVPFQIVHIILGYQLVTFITSVVHVVVFYPAGFTGM